MATDHTLFAPAFAGDVSIDGLWTGVDDGGGVLSWHKTFGGTNSDLAWSAATKTVTNSNGTDATLTDADGANSGLMSVALYDELAAATADIITNAAAIAVTKDSPFVIPSLDDSNSITISHDNTDATFSTDDGKFTFQTTETATPTRLTLRPTTDSPTATASIIEMYDSDEAEYVQFVSTSGQLRMDTIGASPGSIHLQYLSNANVELFGAAAEGKTNELTIRGFRSGDAARTLQVGVGIDAADTASFDGVSNYLFDGIVAADDITLPSGLLESTLASLASDIAAIESGTALATTTEDLLLDVPTADGEIRTVTNFYADHSGPDYSLTFRWSSTSTDSNDDCLCVKPTAIGGGAGRWIAQFSGAINAAWTGVKADATDKDTGTDDTAAIQKAIDLMAYGTTVWTIDWRASRVVLPHGKYRIRDTIHLTYGHSGFISVSLVAEDHNDSSTENAGVIFYSDFSDRPVVNVQGARSSRIEGIWFEGSDNTVLTDSEPDQAVWDAIYPHVDDRPYCAIAVDAFSGDDPGGTPGVDQYPDWYSSAPAALGITTNWNKYSSSKVTIANCRIRYFQSGIAIKPSGGTGADGNGDYVKCFNSVIVNCKWGMTSNGSQTRENSFIDCEVDDCFASIAGGIYGPKLSGDLNLIRTDFSRNAFAAYSNIMNWTQTMSIIDCRAEIVGCIAYAHNGSTASPKVVIRDNHIGLMQTVDDDTQQNYHLLAQNCDVVFDGNYIALTHGALVSRPTFIGLVGANSKVECRGNTIQWPTAPTTPAQTAAEELGFAWIANYRGTPDVSASGNTPTYLPWKKFASVSSSNMASGTLYVHNGAGEYYGRLNVNMRDDYFQAGDFIGVVSNNNNYRPYFFKVTLIEDTPSTQWATLQQINDCDGTTGEPLDAADVLATINTGSWLTFYRQRHAETTEGLLNGDVPQAGGEIRRVTNFYKNLSGPSFELTYVWEGANESASDDCLCIEPTALGGGPGRWIAKFSGAINAAWTGVKADADGAGNGTDDTAALQKAVNLAINGDDIWDIEWNTREVFIPRGSYKTTDTIHLGWGETFQHLTVRGDGELTPYVANGGTIIYPTFTDRPVFVIQGARHYVFQSIDVVGADNTASTFTHPEADPTVWDALSPYYEDDINNPYCGIAIDPYSGDKPGLTPYPEPTIPAELGITSWNRNHSSKVIVRGCRFWYFASGIAIKPSHGAGFDNNADFISAEDCLFVYCKHGITSDGSQNRQTTMVGGGANSGFSAMSGGVYGTLNVTQELKVTDGATFSAMAYIAWCESANWMSRCTIENSMAEILGSICHITNGSTVTPVVNIDGNDFRFTNGDDTNQAMYHVNAVQCMLNITNNRFAIYHSATSSRPMFAFNATTKSTRIEGNSLFYPLAAVNANQTAGQELGWATASRPLSDVTGSSNTPSLYRFHQLHTVQQLQVSLAITHSGAGSWTGTMVGQHVGKVAIGDFISCNPSGNNLQTYFFKVTNIVGSVITMLQLNDTDVNGDPLDAATVKATIESGGTYLAVSHRAEVGDAATQETVTQYPSLTTTPFEINYALGATAIVTLNEALEAISDVTNLPVGASLTLFCTKTSQADSLTLDATNFTTQSATFAADSAAVPVGEMMSVKFTRIKAGSGGGEIYAEQSFAKVDAVSPGHLGVPTIGRINNYWLDETPGALPSGTEGASITIRIMSENVGASPAAKALATGAATHYSYQVTDTGVITPLATDNS